MKHKDEQTKQETGWGHLERHYRYQEELVQRPGSRKEQGMASSWGCAWRLELVNPRLNNLSFLRE